MAAGGAGKLNVESKSFPPGSSAQPSATRRRGSPPAARCAAPVGISPERVWPAWVPAGVFGCGLGVLDLGVLDKSLRPSSISC
jgi:hypothetical protein